MNSFQNYCISFIRKHSNLFRICSSITLMIWFAFYLSLSTSLYKTFDEITKTSNSEYFNKNDLNESQLRIVLNQRGVVSTHLLNGKDLELAINATGEISQNEFQEAMKVQGQIESTNLTTNPDAILYRVLIQSNCGSFIDNFSISNGKHNSIVFESELEFIERVEDNKDSIWLLAVVANHSLFVLNQLDTGLNKACLSNDLNPHIVNDEVWVSLIQRYHGLFGFKIGLLDCQKLHRICIDRDFIQAEFVLALPKSENRMKDSIQFRPFPRNSKFTGSSQDLLKLLDYWIGSVLAERVQVLRSLDDLKPNLSIPMYGWNGFLQNLVKHPQPLHFIWIPYSQFLSNGSMNIQLWNNLFSIPLAFSALSVPYTGRVRFWLVNSTRLIREIFEQLNYDSSLPYSSSKNHQFIIWTPAHNQFYTYGKYSNEFLNYFRLEFVLHLLYPSVDDCLWIVMAWFNLLVFLNGSIEMGHMFSMTMMGKHLRFQNYQDESSKTSPIRCRRHRLSLVKTIIRIARRGWISYFPSNWISNNNPDFPIISSTINQTNWNSIQNHSMGQIFKINFLVWMKIFLIDWFLTNFLILISFLPILNLFNWIYLMPLVNVLLLTLRQILIQLPLTDFYLILSQEYLTWSIFFSLTFNYICLLVLISTCFYYKFHDWLEINIESQDYHYFEFDWLFSLDRWWNDLVRFLTQSDCEHFSNDDDGDGDDEGWSSGTELVERKRLLRRLNELYGDLVKQVRQNDEFPMNMNELDDEHSSGVWTAAHMYRWIYQRQKDFRLYKRDLKVTLKSKPVLVDWKPVIRDTYDTDYEAEDELDINNNLYSPVSCFRYCQHSHTSPRYHCHSSSSSSPSLTSSLASSSTNLSTSLEFQKLSLNDDNLSKFKLQIDWPAWVIRSKRCVVCWRRFRPGVGLGALPCGHAFHETCIRKWFNTGSVECPICRWPAYAQHLRQQCHIVNRLIQVVQCSILDR